MTIYRVKGWSELFENNRTRELKSMGWVPVPNRHDGDGYTTLVDRPDGAAIYGAWVVILQVASRCDPRGTLLRDAQTPHDAASIARMTRLPSDLIQKALDVCLHECKWLEINIPQEGAGKPQEGASIPQGSALEQKGMEGKEGNERNARAQDADAVIPTWEEVKARAGMSGVIPDSARAFFDHHEGNGLWLNQHGHLINWPHKLKVWGSRDQVTKAIPVKSDGPTLQAVHAYAAEKGVTAVYAASWFGFWSKQGWRRGGHLIDWKIELGKGWARSRMNTEAK